MSGQQLTFPEMAGGIGPLYPVVDDVRWIARLLPLGVKTVQLRIKDPAHPELETQIIEAIRLGREHNAQVFINDYWHLSLKHGAYGVHLGQDDLDTADLDALRLAGIRLGVSTRTAAELQRGLAIAPSYVAIGHIFPTPTKDMPTPPQGVAQLKEHLATVAGRYPTVAIGGIDLSNVVDVWQTGVSCVAVVRAVTAAPDTEQALAAFAEKLVR
ncbi:thiamine phosphate synthase [Photobacterium galatheae]|uniref:thiamine phosphate synthase n=1 Tax=Photobacterium galatheae TaxID=1654360 RepID=UPI0005613662|nr:thiamine phosphate synthase [Photobacterium galatheae]MCM0150936.1 thiamine phosphate synthase [Photobacterium galatheae]